VKYRYVIRDEGVSENYSQIPRGTPEFSLSQYEKYFVTPLKSKE